MMVLGTSMGTIICGDGWDGNDCCGDRAGMGMKATGMGRGWGQC